MVHTMIFTVIGLEIQAYGRGAVSTEFPREVYSKLSWPAWTAGIPSDWTLFLPLNSRYIPIHDQADVNLNPNEEVDGEAGTTVAP